MLRWADDSRSEEQRQLFLDMARLNDAGMLVARDHSGREFADMIVDQFEELLEASEKQPLVFALSLHGFIVGQPFRLRPLRQAIKHCVEHKDAGRVWFTRAGDIASYCQAMRPGIIPGSVTAAAA